MLSTILLFVLLIVVVILMVDAVTLRAQLRDIQTDVAVQLAKRDRVIEERDKTIAEQKAQMASVQESAEHAKQIESDYAYRKALMLTLSNVSYDATIVVDPQCKIIAINNTAEALFPRNTYLGENLFTVTGVPELEMMVKDALVNNEEEFEEQLTINDHHYRVRAQDLQRDGFHFIGLAIRDVTQLVKLNRARRDMVANIGHELRTPIANIRLIIDGLFHDQDKPKRKDSISSLRAIAKETDNLLWLVQEMSDLSMIESGQAIVRLIDHPLVEVIDESLERMEERAAATEIQLVRHVPEKFRVLCDRDLIQRVLVNLIHNAIKWSPPHGAITVSAVAGDDEITVSVNDNGPGVPPEAVDRIFERFYQIDSSRSGSEGTGLGLAICRHIVEAHGGRIWAESNRDGGGGRFRFTLLSAGRIDEPDPIFGREITPSPSVTVDAENDGGD